MSIPLFSVCRLSKVVATMIVSELEGILWTKREAPPGGCSTTTQKTDGIAANVYRAMGRPELGWHWNDPVTTAV